MIWELEEKITKVVQNYIQESNAAVVSPEVLNLDARCIKIHVSLKNRWIATEFVSALDYYGGFEYIDCNDREQFGSFTFYYGDSDRLTSCLEAYEEHLQQQKEECKCKQEQEK